MAAADGCLHAHGESFRLPVPKITIEDIMEDAELLQQFVAHVMPKIDWAAEFKSFCAERQARARANIKVVAGRDFS
jgi:hypothetical protein